MDPADRIPTSRGWCRCLTVIALLLASHAMGTGRAGAQGLPIIPDPISTDELMEYADRLDLSRQQRLAVLPLHDQYLVRFAGLRDDDIQRFEDDLLAMASRINPANLQIPPRVVLERLMHQYARLLEEVKKVDRSLFKQVETILTETQLLRIDRVRRARERSMYSDITLGIGGEFNPGAGFDLNRYVLELDLANDVTEQLDPVLRSYDAELLERTIRLHKEVERGFTVILDTIDQIGIRNMTIEEMAQLGQDEEFIQNMMDLFDEGSRPFQKATSRLGELNLDTYRRIGKLLDSKSRRHFRRRYFQRAYRRAIENMPGMTDGFERLLKRQGLSTTQREQLALERDRFHSSTDPLIDEIASLVEKSRQYRTIMDFQNEDEGLLDTRIMELIERRDQVIAATHRRVETILGAELYAQFAEDDREEDERQIVMISGDDGARAVQVARMEALEAEQRAAARTAERDEFLPPPIPPGRRDRFAAALALDDAQRPILDSLYDDYRAGYDTLRDAPQSISDDPEPEAGSVSENQTALARIKDRRRRLEELRALDGSFFDNLDMLLVTPGDADRTRPLRLARRRDVGLFYLRVLGRRSNREFDRAIIDLAAIVDDLDLSESQSDDLAPIIAAHDERIIETLDALLETAHQRSRVRTLRRIMNEKQPGSGDTLRRKIEEHERSMASGAVKLLKQNGRTFAELSDRLDGDARWRLIRAYNELAYPGVYRDRRAALDTLDSVFALNDLSADQHEQVTQIATDYRGEYYDLCDQLVDIMKNRDGFEDFQSTIPIDLIRQEIRGERLKFQRDEASARARARLQIILTDTQALQVRTMTETDDESS